MNRTHRCIIGVIVALASSCAAFGQTVRLRAVVRADAGMPVTLAQLATLEGAAAELGDLVIIANLEAELAGARSVNIPRERIIESVRSSGRAYRSGIDVVGVSTTVAPRASITVAPPAEPEQETVESEEISHYGRATVRGAIEAMLCAELGVTRERARLTFERRDTELLDTSTIGRQVMVRPTGFGDTMPVAVTVYEGERIIAMTSLRVEVAVQREVGVAREPIRRGQKLSPGDIAWEMRWVRASMDPASRAEANGGEAIEAIGPGAIIRERHVRAPITVRRGDSVSVHCVTGTVVIELVAVARQDGRAGEMIELETRGPERRTLRARVSGPGAAVLRAGGRDG